MISRPPFSIIGAMRFTNTRRTLARPLQHHPATLLAGLPSTSILTVVDKQHGPEAKTATRLPFLHTPDGARLSSEVAALH
jgi:hypothetical protein